MMKMIQFNFIFSWLLMFMIIFLLFNQSTHPIMLMFLMIIFNLLIFSNLSFLKFNFMYSIMMFLIMISGLLMIFMYFSSLISNELMKFNLMNFKHMIFMLILFNLMFINMNYSSLSYNQLYLLNFDMNNMISPNLSKFININNIFSYPFNNFTLISMLFILLTFLTIMKINSSSHSFTMRKIN